MKPNLELIVEGSGMTSRQDISIVDRFGRPIEIERVTVIAEGHQFPIDLTAAKKANEIPIVKFTEEERDVTPEEMRAAGQRLLELADALEDE